MDSIFWRLELSASRLCSLSPKKKFGSLEGEVWKAKFGSSDFVTLSCRTAMFGTSENRVWNLQDKVWNLPKKRSLEAGSSSLQKIESKVSCLVNSCLWGLACIWVNSIARQDTHQIGHDCRMEGSEWSLRVATVVILAPALGSGIAKPYLFCACIDSLLLAACGLQEGPLPRIEIPSSD